MIPRSSASSATSAATSSPAAGPAIPVLVNQTFMRKYFPSQNPLGKRLNEANSSGTSGEGLVGVEQPKLMSWEIIGVAGDTKYSSLRREIHPMVYVPLTGGGARFELRTAREPSALIATVRDLVRRTDSDLPIFGLRTQTQRIEELLSQERVIARLASFFGALAVLLACIGLYGLLSYEVANRTREIGIRMALGAEQRDVTRLIILRGINLTVAGAGTGIVGSLALMRVLSSLLYGVTPTDPLTLAAVSLVLIAVGLAVCYFPARRATKVDPLVALRYE